MGECSACRQPIPAGSSYCPHCGHHLTPAVTGQTTRLSQSNTATDVTQRLAGLRCPRCQGMMELGHVLERIHNSVTAEVWVEGRPGHRWSGQRHLSVTTYRCTECGYLESYAGAPGHLG